MHVSYVIGQSNYFGFGFTTLKRKPLYRSILCLNKFKKALSNDFIITEVIMTWNSNILAGRTYYPSG